MASETLVTGGTAVSRQHRLAERVATLISAHVLVGWDTGGQPWST